MAYDYNLISVEKSGSVATATIDNPPINLVTLELFGEISALSKEIEADDDVLVFILKSANPDFFMAHFDVATILTFPTDSEPAPYRETVGEYHAMGLRFRNMPKLTIAQIEGRAGGGGSEVSQMFDIRFGVRGKSKINQMEVPLGILPGGAGTQMLPRLIGRARALEVVLGGDDLDAETGERWGFFNRIFEADEIDDWVQAFAHRVASFPREAVAAAKQSVMAADLPLEQGLIEEQYLFQTLLRVDSAQANMSRFLEIGGQTPEGELRVNELNAELGKPR